jgi:hypothetical protein
LGPAPSLSVMIYIFDVLLSMIVLSEAVCRQRPAPVVTSNGSPAEKAPAASNAGCVVA